MKDKNEFDEETKKIFIGLQKAYEKMVEFKKYKKTPLVVSENGLILEIPYDEIPPTTTYGV